MVKLGGGNTNAPYESSTHREQVAAFHENGLAADRYWFNGRSTPVVKQVQQYIIPILLEGVPLRDGERFIWDVEGEGAMSAWSPAEVVAAAQALAHVVPLDRQGIYLSESPSRTGDWSPVVDLGLFPWVASYGPNDATTDHLAGVLVGSWPECDFIQYTSRGSLPGYAGPLDLSVRRRVWTVHELQTALNTVMGSSLAVDGLYRANTQAVVRAFQDAYGLAVDGVAARQTLTKLGALV